MAKAKPFHWARLFDFKDKQVLVRVENSPEDQIPCLQFTLVEDMVEFTVFHVPTILGDILPQMRELLGETAQEAAWAAAHHMLPRVNKAFIFKHHGATFGLTYKGDTKKRPDEVIGAIKAQTDGPVKATKLTKLQAAELTKLTKLQETK